MAAGSTARSASWRASRRCGCSRGSGHRSRSRSWIGQTRKGHASVGVCSAPRPRAAACRVNEVEHLQDKTGVRLVDALRENGVELSRMHESQKYLKAINAKAYLELHIEQGPVLEAANKSAGVVIGTFGVERHLLRFVGQAAHSGSTPIPMRRDAFLAAAESALAFREIARKHTTPTARVVCTVGTVKVEPGHRDRGAWRLRDLTRSTSARCGRARPNAGGGSCGIVANRRREQCLGRMEARSGRLNRGRLIPS